jgi:hypothetical protein
MMKFSQNLLSPSPPPDRQRIQPVQPQSKRTHKAWSDYGISLALRAASLAS